MKKSSRFGKAIALGAWCMTRLGQQPQTPALLFFPLHRSSAWAETISRSEWLHHQHGCEPNWDFVKMQILVQELWGQDGGWWTVPPHFSCSRMMQTCWSQGCMYNV